MPGQLAFIPPLPSGGIKSVTPQSGVTSVNQPPEIDDVRVDTKDNPYGHQIISENVQVRAMTLTSAQLLALKGADVLIVEAPGIGYSIALQSVSVRQNFKTAAYTLNAGTLKIYLGPSANALPLTGDLSAILTQTATSDNVGIPGLASGVALQALTENVPLTVGNQGAAQFTVGAGTLDVIVAYLVLQM